MTARCPAATGLINPLYPVEHAPGPHECVDESGERHFDHTCACGKAWSYAEPVAELVERLNQEREAGEHDAQRKMRTALGL